MYIYAEKILLESGWAKQQTLHIEKGIIVDIIEGYFEGAESVGVVIPGMINCHSHAFQRAFAGFSEIKRTGDDSFWSWREVMYRFLDKLGIEDVGIIARQLYIEMLKAGYTRVAEFHYLHFDKNLNSAATMAKTIFESAQQAGIGLTFLPVLYQYSGFGQKAPLSNQERFIHSVDEFNQLVTQCFEYTEIYKNTNVGIAPHSLRAVDKASLLSAVEHVRCLDKRAPIHIHIAEQQKEVDDCISFYKKRPVQWLIDNVMLDEHWCLVHATHINEVERKAIINKKAVVGICPTTEANLGDGVFPTLEFVAEGGCFAIGSDSHISVNPTEELRWLEYAQRLVKQKRALLASTQQPSIGYFLWTQALAGGESVTKPNLGVLAIGKQADMLVLNSELLATFASDDEFILDSLVFASQGNMIKDVMVNGAWVIKNGHHKFEKQSRQEFSTLLSFYKNVT
ncbi:formimidoylglutamate deiminase [Pseudocolwellia agarivorans]|uniref:formimidoylglutamate deiminase n=1 Tax=Pseudocolwellia agarivorans TaxID=1911682 RepID=UPI000985CCAA|nr:formimidoylglutamate deiminase [Pseudocolwellia agarivorans]